MTTRSLLAIPSTLKFRTQPFQYQPCHFRRRSEIHLPHQTSCIRTTSIKASLADHNESMEVKVQIVVTKEKLEEAMPSPVQEFTWKNILHTLLDRLQLLVKCLLFINFSVTFFTTIYMFSVNRELVIPVGIFGGYFVAHLMKEISLELFHRSEVLPIRCQPCYFRKRSENYLPHQTIYTNVTSIKASAADHNEPNEFEVEKLKEAMPSLVQEFKGRKVQYTLLDRLQFLVQDALKWCLFGYFIFNFLFDVSYGLFTSGPQLIGGLFSGCMVAHFLKEMSLDLRHRTEENDLKWRRLSLCGFFVLLQFTMKWKVLLQFTKKWFSEEQKLFLWHVGNGGLMQLLWYWRNFFEDAKNKHE